MGRLLTSQLPAAIFSRISELICLIILPCRGSIRAVFVIAFLVLGGFSHAAGLQVFSVKEASPGDITITAGISTGATPSASDFQLRFDEKNAIQAKEIKPVPAAALETSVILCVDQSGSMGRSGIKQIQEALKRVLSKPESQLSVALWTFDTVVTKIRPFSKDTGQLAGGVDEIELKSSRDSKTKLYEAVDLALSELRTYESKGPKRLILITDGKDDGSSITDRVVINEANTKSITIDAIGFGNVSDAGSELLARLAGDTGGYFILAKGSQQLSSELSKLFNLPPRRAFDVLFRYEPSEGGGMINSAQLEFSPAGEPSVAQAIEPGVSAPRGSGRPDKGESDADDKWVINILSVDIDLRILLGALVGVIALFTAYMLSRKKPEPPPPLSPPVPPARPVPDIAQRAPVKRAGTMMSFTFPSPSKGKPSAFLDCIGGPAKGRQFPIEQTVYRIGSDRENDLQASDDYVSHKHASIRYDSGNLYLRDSGSSNGTFLNDSRLQEAAMMLKPDDRTRVGKTTFKLVASQDRNMPGYNEGDHETRVP